MTQPNEDTVEISTKTLHRLTVTLESAHKSGDVQSYSADRSALDEARKALGDSYPHL